MKKTMEELWREIPGFPGYEVSNLGQVRSYSRQVGVGKWEVADSPQRTLRPAQDRQGRRGVNLRHDGKSHFRHIGRLVLLAFAGPPPDGMEVCHNDGNPANDHLTNLRYDTHKANMQDASRHGTMTGPKPGLGQKEVHAIRIKFASDGLSHKELARELGVSTRTIYDVVAGRRAYKGGPGPIRKPQTRLTDQQAIAIRRQRASGKSLSNLAQKYGVTPSAISYISSGKRHIHAYMCSGET